MWSAVTLHSQASGRYWISQWWPCSAGRCPQNWQTPPERARAASLARRVFGPSVLLHIAYAFDRMGDVSWSDGIWQEVGLSALPL